MHSSSGYRRERISVVFYPDYRNANPYQDLLYRSLEPLVAARSGTIDELADLDPGARLPLFHLHWDDELTRHHDEAHSLHLVRSFLSALERFRERGGRVVWTMHNLESNHGRNRTAFAELRERLVDLVDVVHLHSLPAYAEARSAMDLPARKVRIVPHGDYCATYPRPERSAAKTELGLPDTGMIALLPGRISGYKNTDALIEAFLDTAGPDDRLAIVGVIAEAPASTAIGSDPRLVVVDGFATPEQLATWIAASDFVILPYLRSLTSGSAILAASLGRGVLGTRTPGIVDAVTHDVTGSIFPHERLKDALRDALAEGPEVWAERGRAAWAASRARDWGAIGHQWLDILYRLEADVPAGHALEIVQ